MDLWKTPRIENQRLERRTHVVLKQEKYNFISSIQCDVKSYITKISCTIESNLFGVMHQKKQQRKLDCQERHRFTVADRA